MAELKVFEVKHPNHPAMLVEAASSQEAEVIFLNGMGIIATAHRPVVQEATDDQVAQFEADKAADQPDEPLPEGEILGKAPLVEEPAEEPKPKPRRNSDKKGE